MQLSVYMQMMWFNFSELTPNKSRYNPEKYIEEIKNRIENRHA